MLQILLLALAQGIQLDETVITAPRSAATVTSTTARRTVVDGERLRETGERSLPRALAKATGAAIQESNLGGGAPVLRGLLGGRILIVVDGVRLNDSTTRLGPNQSLAGIDPEIVDKVEILRGPASVLYGSDAIGGVILIWTRHRLPASRTAEEPLKMWDGAFRGTYDSSLGSPRVSLGLGTAYQDHGLMAVASGFDYEDYKAGGNEVVPNTGYNSQSLFGAYEYAMGKRETLRLTARVNRDFNVPRTDRMNVGFGQTVSSNQDYRYSLQDRRGYVLSYTDERSGELADLMQIRLSMNTYDEERDITAGDGSSSTFSRDETQTVGIGMDWQAGLGSDHLLTWGVDLAHDDVNSYREQTDGGGTSQVAGNFAPDAQYGRAGVFVQDELFAFDPLFLTMGLRYSVFDYSFGSFNSNASRGDHFSALTASLELARELEDGVVLTSSIAQGFHAPSLDDLANDGTFASGTELSNPDLDPEESLHIDFGVAVEREPWGGAFGVFATRIDDAFGRELIAGGDPAVTGDETYRRANTGRVELVGAELAGHHRLGEDSPYSIEGSIAFVRGRHKDPSLGSGAVPARRVPPLQGMLALDYMPYETEWYYIPNARFSAHWAAGQERLHPQDVSDPRIDPNGTPSWITFDLELWGEITYDADWRVSFLNLTDQRYRVHGSGIDGQGQRAVFGVHVRF